jgi:hypothetical protein
MGSRWAAVVLLASLLLVAFGTTALAAPLDPQATPTPARLTVTPSTVRPGQTIHIAVTGLAGLPIAGKTGCLGILGPGQNVERNLSPRFRPQIAEMATAEDGTGQADAQVPANLVGGSYRVIFGGCAPHGDIAPLATIAQATITVVGPTVTPMPVPRLPSTGGTPPVAALLAIIGGLGLVRAGLALRRAGWG